MSGQGEAGNRLAHGLKKTSIVRGVDGVGEVPVTTDTDKVKVPSVANEAADSRVRLSNMKTMIYQAVMESEKKRYFQVAEVAEKEVINEMEMCTVEGQHGPLR